MPLQQSLVFLLALVVSPCLISACQDIPDTPPDSAVAKALDQITEPSVRGTVSFLASDELGGRGTPSPGFTIASAYVASRFVAAGLEPAGVDGTWYQNSEIDLVQMPRDGIDLRDGDGRAIATAGLLAANDEPFAFEGVVPQVNLRDEFTAGQFSGPVSVDDLESRGGQRYLTQLGRAANQLKQAGATAIIIAVGADHSAVTVARAVADKGRVAREGRGVSLPVVLVPEPLADGATLRLQLPAALHSNAIVRNVIGVLKGSDQALAEQAVLLTAHLDHLGETATGEDRVFNGADDDASGVTAVLTLADALGALPERPARSVLFMTLWGEEQGLLGSRQFAREPTWPLEKIVANINIEMIGRPEPGADGKIWVTGWGESDLGPLMHAAAEPHGGTIFEHPQFSAMLYRSSDNWSFAEKGVIAHSFSAGSLHADYHQLSDHWEKLDTEHMARVIRSLFHGLLPIARAEVTPHPSPNRR